jgi:hypothetical protein
VAPFSWIQVLSQQSQPVDQHSNKLSSSLKKRRYFGCLSKVKWDLIKFGIWKATAPYWPAVAWQSYTNAVSDASHAPRVSEWSPSSLRNPAEIYVLFQEYQSHSISALNCWKFLWVSCRSKSQEYVLSWKGRRSVDVLVTANIRQLCVAGSWLSRRQWRTSPH